MGEVDSKIDLYEKNDANSGMSKIGRCTMQEQDMKDINHQASGALPCRDVCSNITTVILVENILLRRRLVSVLGSANFLIVHSAESLGSSGMSVLSRYPAILLVINSSVGPESVARQIQMFRTRQRTGWVAVLADTYRVKDVLLAFAAGADAYLTNAENFDVLIKALELVTLGETIMPSEILPFISGHEEDLPNTRDCSAGSSVWKFAGSPTTPHFSAQERRILSRLIAGDCNKSIARRMDIAEATVKVHLKSIFCKINVHNRTQAVVWAMSNGWPCDDGLS